LKCPLHLPIWFGTTASDKAGLEMQELGKIFEHLYNFEVEHYKIPDEDSHGEVSEKINAFVKVNKNSSDDLKIVYYAGHSRRSRTNELVWST